MTEPTKEDIKNTIMEQAGIPKVWLEEKYPQYNRLLQGWKLIGFKNNKNTGGNTPVWSYMWPEKSRYSGEKLRQLRAERGVGKRKNTNN